MSASITKPMYSFVVEEYELLPSGVKRLRNQTMIFAHDTDNAVEKLQSMHPAAVKSPILDYAVFPLGQFVEQFPKQALSSVIPTVRSGDYA